MGLGSGSGFVGWFRSEGADGECAVFLKVSTDTEVRGRVRECVLESESPREHKLCVTKVQSFVITQAV